MRGGAARQHIRVIDSRALVYQYAGIVVPICDVPMDYRPGRLTADDLKSFALFGELGGAELAAVAADCILQRCAGGERVIGHADTSFDVLLLIEGTVRVSLYSADGQRVGFHDMPKGTMFGEISAIDGLPRSASVEAVESAEAFHAGDPATGRAKAYRAHVVLDRIFRTAEGERS